ncbi:MAG: type IX secretion system membrane protein PorP/SprF [Bacteroidia bacterium]|nr:type IX secretion system membrane protein PorP/SprF [Bacteroidia bacterium]NNF30949.1 type IX secretion system membrane protein PorP/SprF [Flavobacteriaceae bacterium]MBT8275739.1 type IX secretion system membrane protein PorP/SprF [Bacteroidia bacterium]NNJ82356.1 type IX secretion system membrane protein PorP/SprF [Flavobacteriaceae bacterium]NNK54675.1 type IX secretion system membrane protein PorP/SprF [Flavobacteriaceae bacterium]
MKKLSLIVLLLAILSSEFMTAQQDPQYTQYMYNMNVVNPAYAGSKESLSITALYRNQWSGFDGAPETFTFSAHSPLGDKVGLGLSAIKDELGPVSETNVYADFSYTLEIGGNTKIALGVKAGATFHDVGLTDLELQDPNDPFFSQDISNTYPNVGAGAFLYGDNFYVGLSVPNLLNSVHLDENGLKYGSETNHYFGTAGYVFQVSENVKLKPSVMVKSAFDAPVSFDGNLNALFFEKFEIGASYRLDDSFSGLVGFQVTDNIRIGYAYDYITSDLDAVADASHEVILTFDLFFNKRTLRSPRYF